MFKHRSMLMFSLRSYVELTHNCTCVSNHFMCIHICICTSSIRWLVVELICVFTFVIVCVQVGVCSYLCNHVCGDICVGIFVFTKRRFKSLRLRPPTPEAYGKTADFGTLCIPGSSQRLDPSAALLSSSDRSRLAALNIMLTPCPVP